MTLGVIAFVVIVGLASAWVIGFSMGREDMQREAVKNGKAKYTPDAKGYPVFTWKEDLTI